MAAVEAATKQFGSFAARAHVNVLLVTGSRSLTERKGASQQALKILYPLECEASLVVAGDANGPDKWALQMAEFETGIPWQCFRLDGAIEHSRGIFGQLAWGSVVGIESRKVPLKRNAEMVRHVEGLRGAVETLAPDNWTGPGYETRLLCVGFVDPDSRTHGTDHTLRLARQAGIWTARYVWRGERFEEES